MVAVEVGEPVGRGGDFSADAVLFPFERLYVDGVGVVGVEQFVALRFGAGELLGQRLALGGVASRPAGGLGARCVFERGEPVCGELDALVVVLDLGFEPVGGDVGLAAGAERVVFLAEAEEVGVAAFRVLDRQASPADATEQDAFEVVRVLAFPAAADRPRPEQVADSLIGVGADERLVGAGMLDAVPFDDADVDRVREDLREALPGDRRRTAVGQPAMRQLVGEGLQGPVAGRVQVERGGDVGRTIGVGDDPRDLTPADDFADVGVAEWSGVREPALFGFLGHAFLDLGREVRGVELGHERVNAFDELSARGVLQILRDTDEGDAAFAEQRADRDVVFHVAGEPVQLVHHHRVDVTVGRDAGQHFFEAGPVGGARGLALVDVLVDQRPAGVAHVPRAGFALRRDGEAFGAFAFLGLFLRADP